MFVLLEGFDKVGKTTLLKQFGKINSWEQIIIDRGPAGYLFYDEFFCRNTEERTNNYMNDLFSIINDPMQWRAIYLKSDPIDIIRRHNEAGESIPFPDVLRFPGFKREVRREEFENSSIMQKSTWLYLIMNEYERLFDECYYGNIPAIKIDTTENDLLSTSDICSRFVHFARCRE